MTDSGRKGRVRRKPKLVYGVGINDADYVVNPGTLGDNGKRVPGCPFYTTWVRMLGRVYGKVWHKRHPSYIGCTLEESWKYFMTFRSWMIQQDWEGKQLDKDLLLRGNKHYGPETCIFIPQKLNVFITATVQSKGPWPDGVYFNKTARKFIAQIIPYEGKRYRIGAFDNPEDAHRAYTKIRSEETKKIIEAQSDPRVVDALRRYYNLYTPYAIFCETPGYAHLVSGTSEAEVIDLLLKDIESVGESIKNAYNVYACKGGEEYPALENEVMALINKGE